MINELDNPFSVTKATEFSDEEIKEYWVDFNTKENASIEAILNPREYLPKYVIGGKGCGKTHILRYFSFPLQKIRHNDNILNVLKNDKYLGFYSVFHGLNSSRFREKGINQSEWESIFEYYFELYICDNFLHIMLKIFSLLHVESKTEQILVKKIISIFHNHKTIENISTFSDMINFINELRRKIDYQIQNAAFTRKLEFEDVKILFTTGDLIFGIPNIIIDSISDFMEIKFIYIFDEYEKLFEWQKEFVNTLVWDKKTPVTFWIGARRYGYTTRMTKSGQEMKSGSEFQPIDLDELIRSNEELYKQFAEKLYVNRLAKYYEFKSLSVYPQGLRENFCKKFEAYDEEKIINEIIDINRGKEYKHLKEFRKNLLSGLRLNLTLGIEKESQIEELLNSIKASTDGNPLDQKYKIFYFYQSWFSAKKGETFNKIIEIIETEFGKYKLGEQSEFDDIRDKRKKDFIAQLTRDNKIKNTEYSGIDKFIEISEGNARSFILILKKAIEYSKIKGEKPLEDGGFISLESQYLAVYETARWFYEDAELMGESGKNIYSALKRLTDYLIEERFCDKPVETTVSCFYVKNEELSIETMTRIEEMKMHSIFIENDDGRFAKNSGRKERLFRLNKTLSPLWNLPTVVRGSVYLQKNIAESIFNTSECNNFEKLLKVRKTQLNAPDFMKNKSQTDVDTLFS